MEDGAVIDCPRCDGSGFIPDPDTEGFLDEVCPDCEGEGWIEEYDAYID